MALEGQWTSAKTSQALTETLTTVATIATANISRLHVAVHVSNNSNLDQFVIQIKPHKDAPFQNAYSSSTDFNDPDGILIGTSGDLTTGAADSDGWFLLDTRGVYQVNIQAAQAAGATTTLTIYMGGN